MMFFFWAYLGSAVVGIIGANHIGWFSYRREFVAPWNWRLLLAWPSLYGHWLDREHPW